MPKPYLSICAIYRWEGPYLREWVAFHRLMGVERFFLYDNDSDDEHREALGPYLEDGTVELLHWPEYPMGQELRTGPGVVTVSCLVSDLQYTWRLSESSNPGTGTDISLHVEIPEIEAHRLETQRTAMSRSLKQLTRLASAS